MDKVEKQRELQKLFMESEAFRKQLEELMGQLQLIEGRRLEIESAISSVDSLTDAAEGSKMLVPLGSDVFIRAELKDAGKLIVSVGAGVSVEKNPSEAKKVLHAKADRLSETEKKIQQALSEVRERLIKLDAESKALLAELQG